MDAEIYHLAQPGDWAGSIDEYQPSTFGDEGFIHCSTADQLASVARRHYRDHNDLVLLTIDPEPLGKSLVYEDLLGSGDEYPHVYAPIPTSAVVTTGPYLEHLEEGLWTGETRFDATWLDRMLHPEFSEVGRSGRSYTREETFGVPATRLGVELPLERYRMLLIDEDVALVRYVSREPEAGRGASAERTSVWVNTNDGWRLRFHQGTPVPAA